LKKYFNTVHSGKPIDDFEIIDFHAHLGPYFNMHIPWCDDEKMVHMMDICGISKTILSPNIALCADIKYGNDLMLKTIERFPGRLYGACSVNGNYPELSENELYRCFENNKVKIVKVHPFLALCKMNDRRMKKIYEFASERKLFVLVHTWLDNDAYGNQDLFSGVASDYPDIKWVMGHSGGPHGSFHAVEIAMEKENIFLDTTLSMCPARQIEFFVKEVGAERILFGTDNPFIDPRPQIGRHCLADITDSERELIMGGNVRKYIKF